MSKTTINGRTNDAKIRRNRIEQFLSIRPPSTVSGHSVKNFAFYCPLSLTVNVMALLDPAQHPPAYWKTSITWATQNLLLHSGGRFLAFHHFSGIPHSVGNLTVSEAQRNGLHLALRVSLKSRVGERRRINLALPTKGSER